MISIGSGAGNAFGIVASPDNAGTPVKQTLSGFGQHSYDLPRVIREALMTDADRSFDLDSKLSESLKPLSVSPGPFDGLPAAVRAHLTRHASGA